MAVWIAGAVVVARRTVPTVWAPLARLLAVSMIAGIAAETRIVIEPIHPRFADEQYAPTVRSSQN
jgi:hypothetical protein